MAASLAPRASSAVSCRHVLAIGAGGSPCSRASSPRPSLRSLLHVAAPVIEADTATLIFGGLMVGFGTRLGNGCTSGHGVCGLARLSPRSLAATATFMAAGFLTVFVVRHLIA